MAPPPTYKLTYFDGKGAAEPIRYMLHFGNIQFEDIRIDFAKWPQLQKTVPMMKLPILEFDGKTLYQSLAICRYLARKMDLAGRDDLETCQIDAIADTFADLRTMVGAYGFQTPEADKPKKKEELLTKTLPDYLSRLDKFVKENRGFFVNGKLSYADIVFAATECFMTKVLETDILQDYPHLKALKQRVENLPGIKEWVARRPDSVY